MSQLPPAQPPLSPPLTLDYSKPVRNDLREIALRQRGIMWCIVGYIAVLVFAIFVPAVPKLILSVALLAVIITTAVLAFMLSLALYSTAFGIVLGMLASIPYGGIFPLLVINSKATRVLRAGGIRVGLMGANLSQIPSR